MSGEAWVVSHAGMVHRAPRNPSPVFSLHIHEHLNAFFIRIRHGFVAAFIPFYLAGFAAVKVILAAFAPQEFAFRAHAKAFRYGLLCLLLHIYIVISVRQWRKRFRPAALRVVR